MSTIPSPTQPRSLQYWQTLVSSRPELCQLIRPRLTKYIPHKPHPKEAAFLMLTNLEAFYGGQAGGGKSEALLMAALQYVDIPGYNALMIRKTYQDLAKPEALMDRAADWLFNTDAEWQSDTHTWRFPSGATLSFGYLDYQGSERQYQGAAYQYIAFDELTQHTERAYRYLFSRLRKLEGAQVPIRMRSASNPGEIGHEWVKARFITPGDPSRPFIPATLDDNPSINREEYLAALEQLTPLERAWLRDGNWDAAPGGSLAQRAWFKLIPARPVQGMRVRYWDLAATVATKGKDPDYTVGTLMSKYNGMYTIEHVIRGRYSPKDVVETIKNCAKSDGKGVHIYIEQEPGSGSKILNDSMIQVLAGWVVISVPAIKDKIKRAMPFMRQAESGNVQLVEAEWNHAWLDEIIFVPLAAHDDQWDSSSGAFNILASNTGWARGSAG